MFCTTVMQTFNQIYTGMSCISTNKVHINKAVLFIYIDILYIYI